MVVEEEGQGLLRIEKLAPRGFAELARHAPRPESKRGPDPREGTPQGHAQGERIFEREGHALVAAAAGAGGSGAQEALHRHEKVVAQGSPQGPGDDLHRRSGESRGEIQRRVPSS